MNPPRRVVVVVGAGASRLLGEGARPMPLMADWATSLRDALEAMEQGCADAIGLTVDLSGDVFEARLGEFLAFQGALPLIKGLERLGGPSPYNDDGGFQQWHQRAEGRSARMVETIRANLFQNFGYPSFNDGLAVKAYGTLRSWLSAPDESEFLAFATTNYDAAIETALNKMGLGVLDGFSSPAPSASEILEPIGLADRARQSNNMVPVLHLHGAVGWYRDESAGTIRKLPSDLPYNAALGTPALLLPDATKTIESLKGAEQLWVEFRTLLADATHVLVLSHSLHDKHLVDLIVNDAPNLAVASYSEGAGVKDGKTRERAEQYIKRFLPQAAVIPCDFGPDAAIDEGRLSSWLGT